MGDNFIVKNAAFLSLQLVSLVSTNNMFDLFMFILFTATEIQNIQVWFSLTLYNLC